jgi:ATP-binding cassette subfamily C (CFTR/MRP) protein 1
MVVSNEGEIVDSGTYREVSKRQPTIGEHQEPASHSEEPELRQAGDKVKSLGEYQVQLDRRMDDLRRQRGDWRSYVFYMSSMGWLNFSLFVLGAVTYVVFYSFSQIWITWWAGDTTGRHPLGYWLGLYAAWGVLVTLALLATPL